MKTLLLKLLLLFVAVTAVHTKVLRPAVPIRGWNSWDSFGTANETIALSVAEGLTKSLSSSGYVYLTLDEGWFGQNVHDKYGRLIPDPSMYPSAPDGSFKVLADRLHSMGLKLGIWYMAGIPMYAVKENTPIMGTSYHASDIALKDKVYCPRWHPDWGYAVDHSHPGAAAWYNSLVELWASWGVDLVKVDCINAEDMTVNKLEDVMRLSEAMEASSNDFIFSLSPGGFANASQLAQMRPYSTMARVTDDFWDDWELYMNKGGGSGWKAGASHWDAARDLVPVSDRQGFHIDLDMLPFGRIGHEGEPCTRGGPGCPRQSRYSFDEQQAIMSLWALVRSPLIYGGDTADMSDDVLGILTNPRVLAMTEDIDYAWEALRVNETSSGYIVWKATSKSSPSSSYLAVFNILNVKQTISIRWPQLGFPCPPHSQVDLWASSDPHATTDGSLVISLPSHGVKLFRLGDAGGCHNRQRATTLFI